MTLLSIPDRTDVSALGRDCAKHQASRIFTALAEVRCIYIGTEGASEDDAILEVCAAFCKQLGIDMTGATNLTKEEFKIWAISAINKAEGSLYEEAMAAGAMGDDWCDLEYELSEIVMSGEIRELIKRVISPVPGLLGLYCFVYQANNEPDDVEDA